MGGRVSKRPHLTLLRPVFCHLRSRGPPSPTWPLSPDAPLPGVKVRSLPVAVPTTSLPACPGAPLYPHFLKWPLLPCPGPTGVGGSFLYLRRGTRSCAPRSCKQAGAGGLRVPCLGVQGPHPSPGGLQLAWPVGSIVPQMSGCPELYETRGPSPLPAACALEPQRQAQQCHPTALAAGVTPSSGALPWPTLSPQPASGLSPVPQCLLAGSTVQCLLSD